MFLITPEILQYPLQGVVKIQASGEVFPRWNGFNEAFASRYWGALGVRLWKLSFGGGFSQTGWRWKENSKTYTGLWGSVWFVPGVLAPRIFIRYVQFQQGTSFFSYVYDGDLHIGAELLYQGFLKAGVGGLLYLKGNSSTGRFLVYAKLNLPYLWLAGGNDFFVAEFERNFGRFYFKIKAGWMPVLFLLDTAGFCGKIVLGFNFGGFAVRAGCALQQLHDILHVGGALECLFIY